MSEQQLEKLLTPAEVTEILGVSRRTVSRLIDDGYLPALKIRGTIRFDPEEIRQVLGRRKRSTEFPSAGKNGGHER